MFSSHVVTVSTLLPRGCEGYGWCVSLPLCPEPQLIHPTSILIHYYKHIFILIDNVQSFSIRIILICSPIHHTWEYLFPWSKVDFYQSKRKINCIYFIESNFELLHIERQYEKFLYIHGDHWYFLSCELLNCMFISFVHFLNGLLVLVFLIFSSFYILKDLRLFCNMSCKYFSWFVLYFAYSAFLYIGFFRNFLCRWIYQSLIWLLNFQL